MIDPTRRVWRVGHVNDPLGFVPRPLQGWKNRFDDPQRAYRTVYCAAQRETALREVLQDFRPDTTMIAEYRSLFGVDPPGGVVPRSWRVANRLAPARIRASAPLADADDVVRRQRFERGQAALLSSYGVEHFDISAVRARQRPVTQAFGRWVFDEGAGGVGFRSNIDNEPCAALFEGRCDLRADGPVVELDDAPEFIEVLAEFTLRLA